MAVKGIDVSKWQGDVDFKKVRAAGYHFVMINAGYGRYISQKDEYFEKNYKNAKAAGLDVGAYWYSYAITAEEARQEAAIFLEAVKGKSFEYPLAFDIEDKSQSSLSSRVIGDMIKSFCGYLEDKGYYACIYSYVNFLKNKVPSDIRERYDVWAANFDVSRPDYSGPYGMWQYTSTGRVSGVSTNCDCDYAYKDYPQIMTDQGLNGFGRAERVLDTSGYRKGDKSIGVLAMKELILMANRKGIIDAMVLEDGGFGEGTLIAVNALLKKWGYKQNGIAGERFIKKLAAAVDG